MPELNTTVILQTVIPNVNTDGSVVNSQEGVSLRNDEDSPGPNKVYGTDGSGNKGWQNAGSGGGAVDSVNGQTGVVVLTKTDIGLGNVDNTSDATKNSSVATLTNKTLTSPVINSPTGLVKADVGLGNVDNTSDLNKPISTATQTALDAKVPTTRTIAGVDLVDNITSAELRTAIGASRILLYKNNVSSSVTGTLTETLLDSYTVTAGTMGANDILCIVLVFTKSGTAGNSQERIRIGTTAGTSGTVAGMITGATTAMWVKMSRQIVFKNSLTSQIVLNTGLTTSNTDEISPNSGPTSLSIDFTQQQVISITSALGNTGDTGTLQSWYVELIRN